MTKTITIEKKEGKTRMKAKKSLIITLFAALMVFALGATAIFALEGTPKADWNADYTKVTISGCTGSDAVYNKDYTEIEKTYSDGMVIAALDATAYRPALPFTETASYYDLDNAELKSAGTWSRAAFDTAFDAEKGILKEGVTLMMKDGISKSSKGADKAFTETAFAGDYEVTYIVSGFDPEKKEAQTVDVTANLKAAKTGDAATAAIARLVYKAMPTKKITIEAQPVNWYDMQIAFDKITAKSDKVKSGMTVKAKYDGTAHKIVNSEVTGWTAAWAVQNEKTGAYDAVEAVELKDAGSVSFRLELTPASTTEKKQTIYGTATVEQADALKLKFKEMATDPKTFNHLVYTGSDPWDYVEAADVAESDAVEALAFFKEKYTIEVKEAANNPAVKSWTIKPNKDFDADAAAKTYKTLLNNYNMKADATNDAVTGSIDVQESSDPTLDPNQKADDVTITFAPNKVTYKAKKLKKKAASFTVEAVAASGKEVSFVMTSPNKKISIDSATGTVTVAKKMKKGTYKVKVKAMTTAGAGYAAATDVANVTIKIKK